MENQEIKIFIIEDDFVFVNILCGLLDDLVAEYAKKQITINYHTFYSSKEAQYELQKKPDIILLDYFIMNDELEIDTATKFLKAVNAEDPTIQVVIVSGQEDPELIFKLKRQGAAEYISKSPESLMNLIPVLKQIIDKRIIDKPAN